MFFMSQQINCRIKTSFPSFSHSVLPQTVKILLLLFSQNPKTIHPIKSRLILPYVKMYGSHGCPEGKLLAARQQLKILVFLLSSLGTKKKMNVHVLSRAGCSFDVAGWCQSGLVIHYILQLVNLSKQGKHIGLILPILTTSLQVNDIGNIKKNLFLNWGLVS